MNRDFDEMYNEIYKESLAQLTDVRNTNRKFILYVACAEALLIALVLVVTRETSMMSLSISLAVVILLILYVNGRKIYKKKYKECIISSIIHSYNNKLNFDQATGLSVIDYRMSNFNNTFDEFFSEDRIYGRLENDANIQAAEVATYEVRHYKDSNGETRTEKNETFRGLYGVVKMDKNPLLEATIATNNVAKKYSKKRVEIDSSEFEQYYDCITNDKIRTMQIFTSDLIEKYIDIMNINKYQFEVKIENEMLYFRYRCGGMFEPPTFGMGLDKEFVRKYYKLFFYPLEIIEKTVENIYQLVESEN